MKELGDGVYDELEIDPSDYDSPPAGRRNAVRNLKDDYET